jgi:hypothetical protein
MTRLGLLLTGVSVFGSARLEAAAVVPATSAEIRVLTDRIESHLAPIFAAHEKAAHVKVRAVYLDSGLVSRLESRQGEADLVITKDADLLDLAKQKKLLRPYSSSTIASCPARWSARAARYKSRNTLFLCNASMRAHLFRHATRGESPRRGSRVLVLSFQRWRSTPFLPTSLMPFSMRSAFALATAWSTCSRTSLAYSAWLKRSKPGARRKPSWTTSGRSPLFGSKNRDGLLATSGKSSSMQVSDSTPGQWWTCSTRWLEQGLAISLAMGLDVPLNPVAFHVARGTTSETVARLSPVRFSAELGSTLSAF